jgi:hypothetical protein
MISISSLAKTIVLTSTVAVLSQPSTSHAQGLVGSQQFQELFTAAGYSALFGAALGTAVLPFVPDNSVSNLRIVAGGASLGFVLGSVMALYGLRQQQSQQAFGLPYYQDNDPAAVEGQDWRWDVGTSNGNDVYVRMDSRF